MWWNCWADKTVTISFNDKTCIISCSFFTVPLTYSSVIAITITKENIEHLPDLGKR